MAYAWGKPYDRVRAFSCGLDLEIEPVDDETRRRCDGEAMGSERQPSRLAGPPSRSDSRPSIGQTTAPPRSMHFRDNERLLPWPGSAAWCSRSMWPTRSSKMRLDAWVGATEVSNRKCLRASVDFIDAGNADRLSASILSASVISGIPLARSGHALLRHFGADRSGSGCHHCDHAFRRHLRRLANRHFLPQS